MKVRTTTSINLLEEAAKIRADKAAEFRDTLAQLREDATKNHGTAADADRKAADARRSLEEAEREAAEARRAAEALEQRADKLEPIAEQVQDEADDLYDQAAEARRDSNLPPRDQLVANGQRDTQLQEAVRPADKHHAGIGEAAECECGARILRNKLDSGPWGHPDNGSLRCRPEDEGSPVATPKAKPAAEPAPEQTASDTEAAPAREEATTDA